MIGKQEGSTGDSAQADKMQDAVTRFAECLRDVVAILQDTTRSADSRASAWLGVLGIYAGLGVSAASAMGYSAISGWRPDFYILFFGGLFSISFLTCTFLVVVLLDIRIYVPKIDCAGAKEFLESPDCDGRANVPKQIAEVYLETYEKLRQHNLKRQKWVGALFKCQLVTFGLFALFALSTVVNVPDMANACKMASTTKSDRRSESMTSSADSATTVRPNEGDTKQAPSDNGKGASKAQGLKLFAGPEVFSFSREIETRAMDATKGVEQKPAAAEGEQKGGDKGEKK
ncbi:MAG: hypothetical protein JW759_05635 [Candidatus Coatesbacteria bacterium]|nr:hypothetical protein [Candidatus Coatesbacteria bacterium]